MGCAERSRFAFRLRSVFQGSLYRPAVAGGEIPAFCESESPSRQAGWLTALRSRYGGIALLFFGRKVQSEILRSAALSRNSMNYSFQLSNLGRAGRKALYLLFARPERPRNGPSLIPAGDPWRLAIFSDVSRLRILWTIP